MAAPSLNVVRVRLHFDYPPPAVSTCRMCWLLVDLNRCRVVADLVSVIREKFDYSRKTCLDLFIEDCYLPPSESIYVVRDNDSIRVKAESLSLQNGTESETSKASKVKKRRREAEEQEAQDEQSNTGALKKRKATEESQATQLGVTENVKKKKKSKKRKRKEEQAETAKKTPAVAAVTKPLPEKSGKKQQPSTSALNGKPAARKPEETSSDSSDSSEEEPPKRPKTQQKKVSGSAGPVSKPVSAAKRKDKSSSSDSDTDSGSVQPPPKKPTPAKSIPAKPANATTVNTKPKQPPSKKQAQSSSSDSDSDSDSSSSAERPPPKRTPVRIPPPAPSSNPKTKASAAVSAGSSKKPAAKTAETSSDSDSSSSSERPPVKKPSALCTPKAPTSAPCTPKAPSSSAPSPALKPGEQPSAKPASSGSDSDRSEEEIELVIRKPLLNGMGLSVAEVVSSSPFVGAGRGRGDGRSPGRGLGRGEGRFARRGSCSRDRGRGGGRGNGTPWNKGFRYDSDEEQKRNRRFNDSLTNTSLILQNPPEPTPPRDYSGFPLLAAPPAVGQKIAFKLLELTENYSPEVSAYKEGKITGFNVTTNVIELQLLSRPKVPLEPGKFDLVYENADGSEVVEYAVTQGSQLTERWDSLLEPRLIVESVG